MRTTILTWRYKLAARLVNLGIRIAPEPEPPPVDLKAAADVVPRVIMLGQPYVLSPRRR